MSLQISDRVLIYSSKAGQATSLDDFQLALQKYIYDYPNLITPSEGVSCFEYFQQIFLKTRSSEIFKLYGDKPNQPLTLDFIIETDTEVIGIEITEIVSAEQRVKNDADKAGSGVLTMTNLTNSYEYVGCEYDSEKSKITTTTQMIGGTKIPSILNSTNSQPVNIKLEDSAKEQFSRVQNKKIKKLQKLEISKDKLHSFVLIYYVSHPILSHPEHRRGNKILSDMKVLTDSLNKVENKNFDDILFLRAFPSLKFLTT